MSNIDFGQLADGVFKQLRKIWDEPNERTQFERLYRETTTFFNGLTRLEKGQFTTIFSRVSYAFHKYEVSAEVQWQLHEFRKVGRAVMFEAAPITENLFLLGFVSLCSVVSEVCGLAVPQDLKQHFPQGKFYDKSPMQVARHLPKMRVVLQEIQYAAKLLLVRSEAMPDELIRVRYDETAMNEQFHSTIVLLQKVWGAYTTLNLLDISIDENGVYYPKMFIIEPDYLVDVSAVANCFSNPTEPILYLLKKFVPFKNTIAVTVGNIANHFLDDLMNDENTTFDASFPKVFKSSPLAFTMLGDDEVRQIMMTSRAHFTNLRQMVRVGFEENDINPNHCYLEPSFFSEEYGIQGRLDVWYENPESEQHSAIVELKSGKIFNPNQYGINDSHYVQALLYDLMVKAVYQRKEPRNYILYSGNALDNLRFAPILKTKQNEALTVRNQIVTIEQMLVHLHSDTAQKNTILDRLTPESYPKLTGFNGEDLRLFSRVFGQLTPLERRYFLAFASFTAREHQLSKMGIQGNDSVNGLASLWLSDYAEKNERFDMLSHLNVRESRANQEPPLIIFERTAGKNDLANFRVGDIAILYPANAPESGETVLGSQIFKCSIIDLNPHYVSVKLRFRQFNNKIFDNAAQKWVLEHDQMDHSYNAMYRAIFAFMQFPTEKKSLIFTKRPPKEPTEDAQNNAFERRFQQLKGIKNMTDTQRRVLRKALTAPEYFLLWGPPGTGKTSVMLRTMVEYMLHHTDENVLLLAFTNRAVDEICEAIENVGAAARAAYIRIGSRYSSSEASHHALFDTKIEKVRRREELKTVINKHRIFVTTVAGIQNRQELLSLKTFNRVIIDEASQILEPMLLGLLPQFKQFILIGDHKQLPAVVQQEKQFSSNEASELKEIGLYDMRDSLFERLFLRCKKNGWFWAFDVLSEQGRMHRDIMDFPNRFFYENTLQILPENCGVSQSAPTDYALINAADELERELAEKRVLYFSTPINEDLSNQKVNKAEAEKIAALTHAYCQLFKTNGIKIDPARSIGIITPYRAQIAQIKAALAEIDVNYTAFTVDTVERYQGGARDVILISLCLNHVRQLNTLVSLDTEGNVDRKLNVALTRAKKHLVIVGNEELMRLQPIYRKWLEALKK